jgi:hypothetical protein
MMVCQSSFGFLFNFNAIQIPDRLAIRADRATQRFLPLCMRLEKHLQLASALLLAATTTTRLPADDVPPTTSSHGSTVADASGMASVGPASNSSSVNRLSADLALTAVAILASGRTAYFDLPRSRDDSSRVHMSVKEGQKKGDLEVLEIHEETWDVRVRYRGEELVLNVRRNGGQLVSWNPDSSTPDAKRAFQTSPAPISGSVGAAQSGSVSGEENTLASDPSQPGTFAFVGGASPTLRGSADPAGTGGAAASLPSTDQSESDAANQMNRRMQTLQASAQANAIAFAARNAAILPLPQVSGAGE